MSARRLTLIAASFALIGQFFIIAPGAAQSGTDFPKKPVRLVVPFPAAGTTDLIMRMLQKPLEAASGQPFIVDNRPGGGSVIGTSYVANAAPDGYTILGGDLSLLVNPGLMKSLPYDTVKAFRGVSMLVTSPLVLLAPTSVPANTIEELVALAKEKPGTLNIGSGGYGSSTHMSGEMFKIAAGIDIVHVPFQGVAPVMTALVGGQVDLYFGGTSTALPYIKAGKLKALAVTGAQRNPLLPDVPTFKEKGINGIDTDTYWGIYAPAETPDATIATLNRYIVQALRDPDVAKRMQELGLVQIGNTPEEHTKQMRQMIDSWTDATRKAGIKIE